MAESLSDKRRRAGSIGGRSTVARHGSGHMSRIGRRGAVVLHSKYQMVPVGIGDFALRHRETGEFCPRTINGVDVRDYF